MSAAGYVYRHFDKDGNLLYVGLSSNVADRTRGHQSRSPWFREVVTITVEHYDSSFDAYAAERKAILAEKPRHNNQPRPSPYLSHGVSDGCRALYDWWIRENIVSSGSKFGVNMATWGHYRLGRSVPKEEHLKLILPHIGEEFSDLERWLPLTKTGQAIVPRSGRVGGNRKRKEAAE